MEITSLLLLIKKNSLVEQDNSLKFVMFPSNIDSVVQATTDPLMKFIESPTRDTLYNILV